MKIKITENITGLNFSYSKGQEVEVKKEIADDLIKSGYAEVIKVKKITKSGE